MENIETNSSVVPAPTAGTAAQPAAQGSPAEVANALMSALEARFGRVEAGVAKSIAEQYGMSEGEVRQILEAEKTRKAAQLPPEAQQQLARANDMLVKAEVRARGASMGLLDADAAMALLDHSGVKVQENGAVAGVQEALETLKESKPYLFQVLPNGGEKAAPGITTGVTGTPMAAHCGGPGLLDIIKSTQVKRN